MAVDFSGTYKLVGSDEHLEDMMIAFGINVVLRKLVPLLSVTNKVVHRGDYFEVQAISTIRTQTTKFTLGQEFEAEVAPGSFAKMVARVEGNSVIIDGTLIDDGSSFKMIRTVEGDDLTQETHKGDVVCKRFFKRVEES